MASRIEDYALIGDCQTGALVARDGSIDWLCFPRFDSPACFAALLGTPENGRWQMAPQAEVRSVRRRYRDGTLVLETEFETDEGKACVIDFMPPRTTAPDVIRIVEGREGQVPMRMELEIRFDYGSIIPWVRRRDGGIRATAGPDTLYCRGDVDFHGENMHTAADFTIAEGQRKAFCLTWAPTHEEEPSHRDPYEALESTEAWWREWSDRCTYDGHWREPVVRSMITLKALTYTHTGGLVAAATTSLPEHIGGVRNWDYRYCWLRDATFTLYALMTGGYVEEARQWRDWLVNAVAGTPEKIQIMYGLAGERRLTELELGWLSGYEQSSPVRIGNAATEQHQLDVYGEVLDALHFARRVGLPPDENAIRVQNAMLEFLETDWQLPDEGIWEVRGPKRHFVHSKAMAWVAMDRGVKAVEVFGLPGDAAKWRRIRDQIHEEVCAKGFDPELNSFVQYYGASHVDASLLMLPLVGFLPATDPRMVGTVEAIQKRLTRNGFVDRYPTLPEIDGLPPGEGVFLLCNFWLVDNLALLGRTDEAAELFARLLDIRNDVGLLSEEYDVGSGRLVGNFPQAFSHQGLINSARNLSRAGGPAEDRGADEGETPDV
ncbi:MAG: glycoside hydrolase family 15 protein [Planctomycetota bacterium]|nr:MAG: glycoside hydrolase family 15 protein [Planctomycetota bacterium]